MTFLLIVVFPLTLSIMLIALINFIEEREDWGCTKKPVLKFRDFKKYYFLNPNSWELKRYIVVKEGQEFSFSFFETIAYKNFYKKRKKKKENNEKYERDKLAYIKLLNSVQKDIDDIRQKTNKEINESFKTILEIEKNLIKEEA